MKNMVFVTVFLILASCSDDTVPVSKETVKLSEIYFRFAVEHAAGSPGKYHAVITAPVLKEGIQCVYKNIVGKKAGIYGRSNLQALLLEHVFPGDLSSYSSFIDGRRVQDTMKKRVKALGFKSIAEATQSTNLIAKALVREYAYYSQLNETHKIDGGVKSTNLVLNECAPESLKSMMPG